MKKIILYLSIIISLSLLNSCSLYSCKTTTFKYNEENNFIEDQNGNKYYMVYENWKLEDEGSLIGEMIYNKKRYQLYSDENKLYIQMTSFFQDKEINIFVSEKIKLPTIKEIDDYKVVYNGNEFDYLLVDYYFKDSGITELVAPYSIIKVDIKLNHLKGIVYPVNLYKLQNNQIYIQNNENKYVELNNFPVF